MFKIGIQMWTDKAVLESWSSELIKMLLYNDLGETLYRSKGNRFCDHMDLIKSVLYKVKN